MSQNQVELIKVISQNMERSIIQFIEVEIAGLGTKKITTGKIAEFIQRVEDYAKQNGLNAVQVKYFKTESDRMGTVNSVAEILSLIAFGLMFYRILKRNSGGAIQGQGGGLDATFTKNNARQFKPEDVKIKFKDVAGLGEAKNEVVEFVEFLQNPDHYKVSCCEKVSDRIEIGC